MGSTHSNRIVRIVALWLIVAVLAAVAVTRLGPSPQREEPSRHLDNVQLLADVATTWTQFVYSNPTFIGQISSDSAICQDDRSIEIYRDDPPASVSDTLIGVGMTGPSGNFSFPFPRAPGTYYAIALLKTSGGTTCPATQSPNTVITV